MKWKTSHVKGKTLRRKDIAFEDLSSGNLNLFLAGIYLIFLFSQLHPSRSKKARSEARVHRNFEMGQSSKNNDARHEK